MSAINALANFDAFLRTLRLDRDQHVAIQMHVEKVRQAIHAETAERENRAG